MQVEALDLVNPRLDRMEAVLERLVEVSNDIKQMLAVHEEKLGRHEKYHDYVEDLLETRRRDLDAKMDAVYNTMRAQDNGILDEIRKMREESQAQHSKLNDKISHMEKYIWLAIGGTGVLSWLISYGAPGVMKILGH
jgi:nucleoside-triphosphatase THEP1